MNKLLTLATIVLLSACDKNKPKEIYCRITPFTGDYARQSNTLIPIDTRNVWVYADSIFDGNTGLFDSVAYTEDRITNVREMGGIIFYSIVGFRPPMTVVGDTIYTVVIASQDHPTPDCFSLQKQLYPVSDTTVSVYYKDDKLYNDTNIIYTLAGNFNTNTVLIESSQRLSYYHKGVGLIRSEERTGNGIMRRSRTLKEFTVH